MFCLLSLYLLSKNSPGTSFSSTSIFYSLRLKTYLNSLYKKRSEAIIFTFSIQDLKTKYSELNECQLNLILQWLLKVVLFISWFPNFFILAVISKDLWAVSKVNYVFLNTANNTFSYTQTSVPWSVYTRISNSRTVLRNRKWTPPTDTAATHNLKGNRKTAVRTWKVNICFEHADGGK